MKFKMGSNSITFFSSETVTMKPRHLKTSTAKNLTKSSESPKKHSWPGLTEKDLEGLDQIVKDAFQWEHAPREFQLNAIRAQLLRQNVLIHAGTGSGKTAVAAGPHAHPAAKGLVTFMVSPLIALQEEQVYPLHIHPDKKQLLIIGKVDTFRDEFKLNAVVINSAHNGCSTENMTVKK